MEVIPLGPEAAAGVIRALRENRVVCLLADRDIAGDGMAVEFFGETTTLPAGPATLALRTGATLIPTAVYFRPHGKHFVRICPPLPVERRGRLREDVAARDPGPRPSLRGARPHGARAVARDAAQLAERPRRADAASAPADAPADEVSA